MRQCRRRLYAVSQTLTAWTQQAKLKTLLTALAVFWTATLPFLSPPVLKAQSSYTATDLGVGTPAGINNTGQVAGNDSSSHGYLYSGGVKTTIGTIGCATFGLAAGINNSAQVAGTGTPCSYPSTTHALVYSGGAITDLGALSTTYPVTGGQSGATAINNNSGQVLGTSYTSAGNIDAFLWSGGTLTDISSLGPSHTVHGINDTPQIVGTFLNGSSQTHAFLYTSGTITDLGTLGGVDSYGYGVNNAGQVVGYSAISGGAYHAFIYSGSTMTDMGVLSGGATSKAFAINNSGQIVGTSTVSGGAIHAFLYSGGTMIDLNSRVTLPSGAVASGAFGIAINDRGQIVVAASDSHTYLLTPMGSKTLGSPCNRPGGCQRGDPVDVSTGNLFEQVTDYATAGQNKLTLARYYNSFASGTGSYAATLGGSWRSNYDRYLHISPATGTATSVTAERPDGQGLVFTLSGSVWVSDTDVDYTLTNSGTTWTLTGPDDTVETYTASSGKGTLNTIEARNTYTQTMAYTSGLLSTVTDSYSRALGFTYTSGLLTKVTTPDSTTTGITFGYTSGMLTTVTYPTTTATTVTYLYENSSLPTALTGITDENSHRYATWAYDTQGRATSSKLGDTLGANLTTFTYNTGGTVTVTNALGVADTYTFSTLQGVPKATGISRASTSTTAAATRTLAYDTNGYLDSSTDWNGNSTTLVNNSHGLPTTINEAVGTSQARTTTIAYDTTFVHLPHTIATTGLTTTFAYDTHGNALTKSDADTGTQSIPYSTNGTTRTWTNVWTATGQLTSVTGPRSDLTQETQFGYTGGTLTSITDALSHVTSITASTGGGLPETIVDPNSVTTTITYDGRQRMLTSTIATTAGNLTTTYLYDSAGELTKTTLPDSSFLSNTYDNAHRLTRITNALSEYINYTLDALGDRTAANIYNSSATLKRQHTGTFDALGRVLQDIGGMSQTTTFVYDNNGNATTVTDPLTHAAHPVFDALNRLSQVTDQNSGVTKTTYDTHNRVLTVVDPNNHTTTYTRDGFGRVIQTVSPDSGTTVYHYDLADNLTKKTDGASVVINHTYDALNRELTRTFPGDTTENVTFTYDQTGSSFSFGVGRLTSLVDAAGSLSYLYDERGNSTYESRIDVGGIENDKTIYYDNASRVSGYTYPSGYTAGYTRDAAGQISSLGYDVPGFYGTPTPVITSVTHLPFGPVSGFSYANGINRTTTFDLDYRQTLLKDAATATYQNLTYAYNANDNVTSITDAVLASNTQTPGYDVLNRLTSAVSGTGGYGTFGWTYDANSNRLTETNGTTATYTYATGTNRLATTTTSNFVFGFNGAGENTTVSNGSSLFVTYNPNQSEQQYQPVYAGYGSPSATYIYDAFGNRESKSAAVYHAYVYGNGIESGNLIEEGNTVGQTVDYLYLDTYPVAQLGLTTSGSTTTEVTYYIHSDRLGTPQYVTDPSKTVQWHATYNPFGGTIAFTTTFIQSLRMPGQYYDDETGLYHNGARDYFPITATYIQTDPIGMNGGTNTYIYANQNPFRMIDPTGLDFVIVGGGTLNLYSDNGLVRGVYPYTSGMFGSTNYKSGGIGPTPPGQYTVLPSEISPTNFFRSYVDPRDWGDYRVPLHPDPETNTYARSGFFLHGGRLRHGSEGCIKVEGDTQDDLFIKLQQNTAPVTVFVLPPQQQ